jgi:uncharacterized protein with PQ loop repeat
MIRIIRTGSVGDLSPYMFMIHSTGVVLWIFYGVILHDLIIVSFNGATIFFNLVILFYFIRGVVSPSVVAPSSDNDGLGSV